MKVGMPNSDLARQLLEDTLSTCFTYDLNREVAAFASCSCIAFASFTPSHQLYRCTKGQSDLLVTPTNSQRRLGSLLYYLNNPSQRLGWIPVPRMTLPTQNNMGRAKLIHPRKRNSVVGLN